MLRSCHNTLIQSLGKPEELVLGSGACRTLSSIYTRGAVTFFATAGHHDNLLQSAAVRVQQRRSKHNYKPKPFSSKAQATFAKKFLMGHFPEPQFPFKQETGSPDPQRYGGSLGGSTPFLRKKRLNAIFTNAVSDVLSGHLGTLLVQNNISITKVDVGKNLINVNIYWVQTIDNEIEKLSSLNALPNRRKLKGTAEIEELLNTVAVQLRQELANMRLVGCTVPHVKFVRDMTVMQVKEMEEELRKVSADFMESEELTEEDRKLGLEILHQSRNPVPDYIFENDFEFVPVVYLEHNTSNLFRNNLLSKFTPWNQTIKMRKSLDLAPPVFQQAQEQGSLKVIDSNAESQTDNAEATYEGKKILLREPRPPHGVYLAKNVFGINRDKLMRKIEKSFVTMKQFKQVCDLDVNKPFELVLKLPGSDVKELPPPESYLSRNQIQRWTRQYATKSMRYLKPEEEVWFSHFFKGREPVYEKVENNDEAEEVEAEWELLHSEQQKDGN